MVLKTLFHYLFYENCIVHTDYAALRRLLTIQEPSGRLLRWRLRLAQNNFQVQYKNRPHNAHHDPLSRLGIKVETTSDDWHKIPSSLIHTYSQSSNNPPPKQRFKTHTQPTSETRPYRSQNSTTLIRSLMRCSRRYRNIYLRSRLAASCNRRIYFCAVPLLSMRIHPPSSLRGYPAACGS